MKPLRICFVLPKLPVAPNGAIVGGATNSAIGLALALLGEAVDLDIIAPLSTEEVRALKEHPIHPYLHPVPLKVRGRTRGALYRVVTLHRAVAAAHGKRCYDIVHMHSGSILYGGILAGLPNSTVKLHSVYCPVFSHRQHRVIGLAKRFLANLAAPQIDSYLGVTDIVVDSLQRALWGKEKTQKLPMSVDVKRFSPSDTRVSQENQGSSRKPFQLLFVGNASEEKGLEVLIQALRMLVQQETDIVLIAALENRSNMRRFEKRRRRLEKRIERYGLDRCIRLVDEMENVAELICQVDAVAIPFQDISAVDRVSGYPMILLEAMACGKCVVSTPLDGVREIVNHDQNGVLSASFSAESFFCALRYAATCPETRSRLGTAARHTIVENYSTHRIAVQLLDHYVGTLKN